MTALERDVLAWTKAKLRLMAATLADDPVRSEIPILQFHAREADRILLARGTKMLAKKGGAK